MTHNQASFPSHGPVQLCRSAPHRFLRAVLIVVLVLTTARVWLGPVTWTQTAQAQIPNAGEQRLELIQEIQRTNRLLEQVLVTLRTQTFKVEIPGTDKPNVPGSASPRPQP